MSEQLYATRDEVRAFDRHCIETLGIPGIVLMENAGRQIADVARAMLDRAEFRHCLVLAGRGNNGGDAFVAARHLAKMIETGADFEKALATAEPAELAQYFAMDASQP